MLGSEAFQDVIDAGSGIPPCHRPLSTATAVLLACSLLRDGTIGCRCSSEEKKSTKMKRSFVRDEKNHMKMPNSRRLQVY